ncbi:MAG TPA: sulfatase-like hydrolase/transferase [Candidatus Rhabdochlamydia sp.]|jgi:glucan phosphoethanolaminetransferase (alkaline phosphatase superfamily)|nr:sulfatase-like hydrolase/transferase [Candidatus Rhabdochlamydia sp.]
MKEKSINYWFFGFYFLLISILHIVHLLLKPSAAIWCVDAIGQCALETILLMILAKILSLYIPFAINIVGLSLFLILAHILDFPLVRLMDISFWFALNFMLQEGGDNILELLYASNISLSNWVLLFFSAVIILILSVLCFKKTQYWSDRIPLYLSFNSLIVLAGGSFFLLCGWDLVTLDRKMLNNMQAYQKILPWKTTFFVKEKKYLEVDQPILALQEHNLLEIEKIHLDTKPDIYLFIVESLREDFINQEIAPHLSSFKEQALSFSLALANANATHLSWFSLFYSQLPFHWNSLLLKQKAMGSPFLQTLKASGYRIHVYASSRLGYYGMEESLFGHNRMLIDKIVTQNSVEKPTYLKDQSVIDCLIEDMQQDKGGRVFITFLDSTHLDYSWPLEKKSVFEPVDQTLNYLKALSNNKEYLEKIKNRYRNALHFVDSLFGRFFTALASDKDALVVITGDHGEEFYEQGHLFHASHLSYPQVHVPLYYRLGNDPKWSGCTLDRLSSHMDIFPTLFHYLLKKPFIGNYEGQSVLEENHWPYAVITRFNACFSPTEFCIHDKEYKAIFRAEKDVFSCRRLQLIDVKTLHDDLLTNKEQIIEERFKPALQKVFSSHE